MLLGAPLRGSPLPFQALIQDATILGLGVGLRDSAFTMPVAWQLLPPPGPDGLVPVLGEAGEERVALYALETWRERGWLDGLLPAEGHAPFAAAMLARAAGLHRAMAGSHPAEDAVPRLAVGADCRPTPGRLAAPPGLRLSFRAPDPRVGAPGDGVVTAESALGPPARAHAPRAPDLRPAQPLPGGSRAAGAGRALPAGLIRPPSLVPPGLLGYHRPSRPHPGRPAHPYPRGGSPCRATTSARVIP